MKSRNKFPFEKFFQGRFLFFLFWAFTGPFFSTIAQPFIDVFRIQPAQRDFHFHKTAEIARRGFLQNNTTSDTLPIPFFDDFSRPDLTWTPSRFWYGFAIRSIKFLDASNARAYGHQGISLRTGNRGSTWQRSNNSNSINFHSVSFPSPAIAWSCGKGGWLGFSLDSGITWNQLVSPAGTASLEKISFISQGTGMLIDSAGTLYRTANGGSSWSNPTFSGVPGFRARTVVFLNQSIVVAAGDSSRTAYSDDAGLSFTVSAQPFGRNRHFRNIRFVDGISGLAIGDSGMVFKTLSSGSSWFPLSLISEETILDAGINPANKNICWLVGTRGALFHSQNGGNSWKKVNSGTKEDLLCIDLVNEFRGWIGTSGGRLHQVSYDPLRPYSLLWESGSGALVNNGFSPRPLGFGVATLDGLNSRGEPYSLVTNSSGQCDSLTSARLDLQNFQSVPLFLSFYYQPGTGFIQLIPDEEDSLAVQFQAKSGRWISLWNVKGKGDSIRDTPFRYVSLTIPDSLKYRGSRFRFVNFGNQNGNFDNWNLDYIRLDSEHDAFDSLAPDYAMASLSRRMIKRWSALPLEQFRFAIENNLPIFEESIRSTAVNLNPGPANLGGSFFLNLVVPDTIKNLVSLQANSVSGLENPFGPGIFYRNLSVQTAAFQSLVRTNQYSTFEYGVGLSPDPQANRFSANDSLKSTFNVSTVMAYDDGGAELIFGVGGNGSKGMVKYYLPVTDTLTDIQLNFIRTPQNLQQTISFALLLYDSLDPASNYPPDNVLPLIRKTFILPPADSLNQFTTFSLRDDGNLQRRILEGGKSFFIGWQQGLIDNANEVRVGLDVNTKTPSVVFYQVGGQWLAWNDSLTPMIRPVFGSELVTSVKDKIGKPQSPFYPNPAHDAFCNRLAFSRLEIRDITGKIVFEKSEGVSGEIIRPALPSGLYFLRWMENGRNPVVQKMLME